MTNAELREALKREIAIPHEELKFKHPTVDDIGTEFVDYTENGELTLAYPLKPEQRNGYQLLQGGYIPYFSIIISDFSVMYLQEHSRFPQ